MTHLSQLNQFTGVKLSTLYMRRRRLLGVVERSREPDFEGGSGSPLEHTYEMLDDLDKEIARREQASPPA